jgi:hypothetical protein
MHIFLVIFYIKHGRRRIIHAPDNHDCNFNRVATLIVDLELGAFQVASPKADLTLRIKRIDPIKAGFPNRADIRPEKGEQAGFIWLDRKKATEPDHRNDEKRYRDNNQKRVGHRTTQKENPGEKHHPDRQKEMNPAISGRRQFLSRHLNTLSYLNMLLVGDIVVISLLYQIYVAID